MAKADDNGLTHRLSPSEQLAKLAHSVKQGGPEKYRQRAAAQGKLLVRERLRLLLDPGEELVEDGLLASHQEGLSADAVVTGIGPLGGRPVTVIACDPTVKAGSWGPRSVEKILRAQESAERLLTPIIYLIDSAGARITDQLDMFPNRRGAGRIFHNQVRLSGLVPQICAVLGPSAAGGAYIPALCDVVVMRRGQGSMFLGSPRMVEMVIGEKVGLEELGGAETHCRKSGCADSMLDSDAEVIAWIRRYLGYLPSHCDGSPPLAGKQQPASEIPLGELIPEEEWKPFQMRQVLDVLLDGDSWLELKSEFAPEILTGLARLAGEPVGVVASQPAVKGGVLFGDSADKAARFVNLCDAFGIPLLFLLDVPGFMVGSKVEKAGIIRHGAKMITAIAEATVPKVSVVLRKAYGAGLYAMAGPAFEPDACLALPSAKVAVMGAKAAVNAVYFRRLAGLEHNDRAALEDDLRAEYEEDINIFRLANHLAIDGLVEPHRLRAELIRRFRAYRHKTVPPVKKKRSIAPV